MDRLELTIRTGEAPVTDVTRQVRSFAAEVGTSGIVHAFLPHATCGLALIEVGAGSDEDLGTALEGVLPREGWRHVHGSTGHGRDHVLPAFISPSLSVPVDDGQLYLGTWQSVVIVDTNVDNPVRTLRLSFIAGGVA